MNSRDKIRELLKKALGYLNPSQFADVRQSMLEPQRQDALTNAGDKTSFLNDIERWGMTESLINYICQEWPVSGKEECEELKKLRQKEVDHKTQVEAVFSRPYVEFVNRTAEIRLILQSKMEAQYWVIDAPPGYGKTEFLRKIQEEYESQGWLCCSIDASPSQGASMKMKPLGLAKAIMWELGCVSEEANEDETALGYQLATCILKTPKEDGHCLTDVQFSGVAILVDNLERLDQEALSGLGKMVQTIRDGLADANFFSGRNSLLVFLSGRNARRLMSSVNLAATELSLSPFSFNAVQQTVEQYALKVNVPLENDKLLKIAANLMTLTGGHPGCMATILSELADRKFSGAGWYLKQHSDQLLEQQVIPVADEIMNEDLIEPRLTSIMETLSVFRRYDPKLLREILVAVQNEFQKTSRGNVIDDAYAEDDQAEIEKALLRLEQDLTATQLLGRKQGFLQDDILRRLLAIRLRHEDSESFERLCIIGADMYEKRLRMDDIRHVDRVAVEYLYQKLQYEYYVQGKRGAELRANIAAEYANVLNRLRNKWEWGHEVILDVIEILNRDWELEFLFNYMCSGRGYDNTLYEDLLRGIQPNS